MRLPFYSHHSGFEKGSRWRTTHIKNSIKYFYTHKLQSVKGGLNFYFYSIWNNFNFILNFMFIVWMVWWVWAPLSRGHNNEINSVLFTNGSTLFEAMRNFTVIRCLLWELLICLEYKAGISNFDISTSISSGSWFFHFIDLPHKYNRSTQQFFPRFRK